MADIYVRRTSTPCIRRGMGDVKACHVDAWQSIRNLMPCITRGIYCEFTSRSKRRPLLKCLVYRRYCSTNGKLRILVKAQPAPQPPGHCHQLGLAYGRETWVYPMNTLSATVAFLLLPDTNLLPQAGITHYSLLLTRQHSTKLLLVFFFEVDLSLSSKFRPPHEGFRQATS